MADDIPNPNGAGPSSQPVASAGAGTTGSNQPGSSAATPSPATPSSTDGSVSFSQEQVAVLLGALSRLQVNPAALGLAPGAGAATTGPAPEPVTASSFPQFAPAVNLPSSGTSLLDLFPSVKASILLDIARHDFEPSDLYKLDPKYRDKAARSVLDFDGTTFTLRDPSTKDYPSFRSVFAPLMTYFNILTAFAASSGNAEYQYQVASGAFFYMSQLEQFNDEYQWSAVLLYHINFHHKRRREMTRGDYSGWAQVDSALHAQHLCGKERQRVSAARGTQKNASGSGGSNTEVCRLFNRGVCTSPCRNKRIHKCSECGSADHGQSTCTKNTA